MLPILIIRTFKYHGMMILLKYCPSLLTSIMPRPAWAWGGGGGEGTWTAWARDYGIHVKCRSADSTGSCWRFVGASACIQLPFKFVHVGASACIHCEVGGGGDILHYSVKHLVDTYRVKCSGGWLIL